MDGWVARRTDSVTAFGARFDGEVDAFLILVLSVAVSAAVGWWVVVAGLARYAFWAAGGCCRGCEGGPAVPVLAQGRHRDGGDRARRRGGGRAARRRLTVAALVGSLVLLAESFGRDVWWLWRRRSRPPVPGVEVSAERPTGRCRSGIARSVGDVLALVLVWFVLLLPARPDALGARAFGRVPLEAVLFGALAVLLPARWTRRLALATGALLGVITVVKVVDLGAWSGPGPAVQRGDRPVACSARDWASSATPSARGRPPGR